jgi:hypothetical protein
VPIPASPFRDSLTCPFKILSEWKQLREREGAKEDDLFLGGEHLNMLGRGQLTKWLQWMVDRAKVQRTVKAHSLRIGGATALARLGVSIDDIQALGQWKSGAFWLYIRRLCSAAQRGAPSAELCL